jgi:hypothetical protein
MAATLTHGLRGLRVLVVRFLLLTVTLVLVLALIAVWARVVQTLAKPADPRPPIGQPRSIVWQNRVFTTDGQLRRFLHVRGLSYSRWVSRHPAAFAVLHKTTRSAAD